MSELDVLDMVSGNDMIGANIAANHDKGSISENFFGNPSDHCEFSKVLVDGDRVLKAASDSSTGELVGNCFNSDMIAEDENLKTNIENGNIEAEAGEVDSKGEIEATKVGVEKLDNVGEHGTGDFGGLCMEVENYDEQVGLKMEVDCNFAEGANLLGQHPDDEEEDSLVINLNVHDLSQGKVVSDNTTNYKGTDLEDGFTESRDPAYTESTTDCNEEVDRSGSTGLASIGTNREQRLEIDKNEFRSGILIPEKHERENRIKKEGEYFTSDLVWGKVRSHPWWPGQIFEPSSASDKAMKYFKKDRYLIAYFGDQTFAWNDASKIRPFQLYFSEMESQSKADAFEAAVDEALNEVSRRVESELVCQCLQEGVLDRVKCQVVINAGIREQCSKIYGGDSSSEAASFSPTELLDYLKSLAEAPDAAVNRIQAASARGQLSAFRRWKGYAQLPAIEQLADILDNDANEKNFDGVPGVLPGSNKDNAPAAKGRFSPENRSSKRKHLEADGQRIKMQHVTELMPTISSGLSNGENIYEEEVNVNLTSVSFKEKRKAIGAISVVKVRKGFSPAKLLKYLKSLAEAPATAVNRFQDATATGQLSAFRRWKGSSQLPAIEQLAEILDNDTKGEDFDGVPGVLPGFDKDDAAAVKGMFSREKRSRKGKHLAADGQRKKMQHVTELMPTISSDLSNGENICEEANVKLTSVSYKRKRKANGVVVSGSGSSISNNGKRRRQKANPQERFPADEMLSKLVLVAENPVDTCTLSTSIAGFFSNFRNSICLENNIQLRNEESPGKLNSGTFSKLATAETFKNKGMEDSYWTDRIIQNHLGDQVLFEPKGSTEKGTLVAQPEVLDLMSMNAHGMARNNLEGGQVLGSEAKFEKDTLGEPKGSELMGLNNDKDHDINAVISDADKQKACNIDENSDEFSPTVLILNFNNVESIPSVSNLNKIFNRYGPLMESETKILCKSKRAKMVFKRRRNAETAFSSTGKYSTFGPSLVSYRLKYLPKTYKFSITSKNKRRRKSATSAPESGM